MIKGKDQSIHFNPSATAKSGQETTTRLQTILDYSHFTADDYSLIFINERELANETFNNQKGGGVEIRNNGQLESMHKSWCVNQNIVN